MFLRARVQSEIVKLSILYEYTVYFHIVFKAIIEKNSIDLSDKLKIITNYNGGISKVELLNKLFLDLKIQSLRNNDEIILYNKEVSPLI